MSEHKDIFDDDSEEEVEGFKINEGYASRYDKWRSKEEYEKLKARAPTFESSSDESAEEDGGDKDYGKPNNPEFDREFLLSIGTIYKHKKGNVKLEDVQFFTGDYRLEKEKEEKPMTLKDFERHVIMERGGKFEEDEIDTRDNETIVKNAEKIKLADGLDYSDDDDDDGDGLLTSGLFKVKEDSNKETKEEASETAKNVAVEYVKGVNTSVPDPKLQDVLETVKGEWNSDKLTKKDKWLVDFFLNERYLAGDSDDEGYDNDGLLDEEEMSEDQTEDEANPLATQYKFRHQEPGDIIKRHPRVVPDTLRQKDERRKERREAAKTRQLMKKEEKKKEIELLKAMKYKEIEEKIDKIREASGNEDIDLGDIDLEEDFDPAAHDAYMERMLGENYFDEDNAEEELPEFQDVVDDTKIYDNWTQPSTSNGEAQLEEDAEGGDYEEDYYGEDFNMDADYNPENDQGAGEEKPAKSSTRRKTRHQSKFSRALEKKKPLFDPKEKDFASYFDEYYKLDFEDVVGGIPCRFKYRKVESNNFGLTTGEILAAQNSDLNKWVGLKKIMQYNRSKELEEKERVMYSQRASHTHVKQKILPSLFDENPEELAEREREKRRLKNQKRKQKKWMLREALEGENETPAVSEEGNVVNKDEKQLVKDSTPMLPGEEHTSGGGIKEETLKLSVVSEVNEKSKKKKKHKKGEDLQSTVISESLLEENTEGQMDTDDVIKKKKKRKHKDHMEDMQSTVTETPKKKKKRKEQMEESQSTPAIEISQERENCEEGNLNPQQIVEDIVVKKKKKKKRDKDPVLESPDIETTVQSPKRERRKPEGELEATQGLAAEERLPQNVEVIVSQDEVNVKKKKKKKHKEQEVGEVIVQTEAEEKEPVSKKKKHKKNGDVHLTSVTENPLQKRKSKKKAKRNIKKMKEHLKKQKGLPYFQGISDARLEAYGQNPKKLKNRVLYGKDF